VATTTRSVVASKRKAVCGPTTVASHSITVRRSKLRPPNSTSCSVGDCLVVVTDVMLMVKGQRSKVLPNCNRQPPTGKHTVWSNTTHHTCIDLMCRNRIVRKPATKRRNTLNRTVLFDSAPALRSGVVHSFAPSSQQIKTRSVGFDIPPNIQPQ